MAHEHPDRLSRCNLVKLDGAVLTAAGNQMAIRTKGKREHVASMADPTGYSLAGLEVTHENPANCQPTAQQGAVVTYG
jgi:hypothetical protein